MKKASVLSTIAMSAILAVALFLVLPADPAHAAAPIAKEFVYVSNAASGTISGYAADPRTGALTPLAGSPFPSGTGPGPMDADPKGEFLYVGMTQQTPGVPSNCLDFPTEIWVYRINQTTGALTRVQVVSTAGPNEAFCVTDVLVGPRGENLYVVGTAESGDGVILIYNIDPVTGELTRVTDAPSPTTGQTMSIAIHPTGKWAFVTTRNTSGVLVFERNRQTGGLSPEGRLFAAPDQNAIAVTSNGQYLITGAEDANEIYVWEINSTTGELTLVAGAPFAAPGVPQEIVVHGNEVFVTTDVGLAVYRIASNGTLTPVSGSPFSTGGSFPWGVSLDAQGQFIYVTNFASDTLAGFRINRNGTLTHTPGSPYPTGGSPIDVVVVK